MDGWVHGWFAVDDGCISVSNIHGELLWIMDEFHGVGDGYIINGPAWFLEDG